MELDPDVVGVLLHDLALPQAGEVDPAVADHVAVGVIHLGLDLLDRPLDAAQGLLDCIALHSHLRVCGAIA